MSGLKAKRYTILHFANDRMILSLRSWILGEMGYRVLNASKGVEAIQLGHRKRVDAVLLDVDHNAAEVKLIAKEMKQRRPDVPIVVLAGTEPLDGLHDLADVLVPRANNLETTLQALERVVAQRVQGSAA